MTLNIFYKRWLSPQRWLERIGIRPHVQIVLGLVLLTFCALLIAAALEMMPNEDHETLRRRGLVARLAGLQAAIGASHEDYGVVRDMFNSMIDEDDLLAVGLRSRDGLVVIETPQSSPDDRQNDPAHSPSAIHVPLFDRQRYWGDVELDFKPLPDRTTWVGYWSSSPVQLMVFVSCLSFLLFWLYLSKMLHALDPSAAVPQRMQTLIDTLVEGMVILDTQGRIVMANESFAKIAFQSVDQLIGRSLSSLPWLEAQSEEAPESTPWAAVYQSQLPQRAVPLRLSIAARHSRSLYVNASPIVGENGLHHGVVVTLNDETVAKSENQELADFIAIFSREIRDIQQQVQSRLKDDDQTRINELARRAEQLASLCHPETTMDQQIL